MTKDEGRNTERIGAVGGAEVLVDLEGHRPVVVVRDIGPIGVGASLAGVLLGMGWRAWAWAWLKKGAAAYEFRIPWDEEVEGVVEQLVDVLVRVLNAATPESMWKGRRGTTEVVTTNGERTGGGGGGG